MGVTFRDSWNNVVHQTTTLTVQKPTNAQTGDLLIVCIMAHHLTTQAITINTPSGWTAIQETDILGSSRSHMGTYWKILEAGETSWDWTEANGKNVDACLACLAYYGHDQSNPICASSEVAEDDGDNQVTGTGINMSRDGILLGHFASSSASPVTWTPPSGMTERIDQATNRPSYRDASQEVCEEVVGSGATGSRTATASNSMNYAGAHMVGIIEAAGNPIVMMI